jgi:hypothetical protein
VGVAAIRWDWPRAPLLLALVLGDIAERYLFLSYSLYEWSWLLRPLVIAFVLVTAAGIVWPVVRRRRGLKPPPDGRSAGASAPAAPANVASGFGRKVARADAIIASAFLVVAAAVIVNASSWPFRSAVFPLATASLLLVLALIKLVSHDRRLPANDEMPDAIAVASRGEWLKALAWLAVFFVLLWFAGALIAVPVFTVAYLLAASRASALLAGSYALASWAFVYGLFDRLLRIPLP